MIISFSYKDQHYVNFNTESDDFNTLKIPTEIKAQIVNDAKWQKIRLKREPLMNETDWTQMPDAPLTPEKKKEFVYYRQKLRDIPNSYSYPDDVIWPEKPTT